MLEGDYYELRSENDVLGTLHFPWSFDGILSGTAVGKSIDGHWRFEETEGLLGRKIEVRILPTHAEVGMFFQRRFFRSSARFKLRGGGRYVWRSQGTSIWTFASPNGDTALKFGLQYEKVGQVFRRVAQVEISAIGAGFAVVSLLILLGGLLVLLWLRDMHLLVQLADTALDDVDVD
jgi:hypothetical protein